MPTCSSRRALIRAIAITVFLFAAGPLLAAPEPNSLYLTQSYDRDGPDIDEDLLSFGVSGRFTANAGEGIWFPLGQALWFASIPAAVQGEPGTVLFGLVGATGERLWGLQGGAEGRRVLVGERLPRTCDTDTDQDGLADCVETGTGVFRGLDDTGTSATERDTDGDGIGDGDEVLGTVDGLDLPAMGVSPLRKDILIEYDWFEDSVGCGPHSHRPTDAILARVAAAFASAPVPNPDGSTGINLVQDVGQDTGTGGPLIGGEALHDEDGVIAGGVSGADFKGYKAAHFAANRNGYFHYTLLPHRYNTNSSSSGQAEINGDDLIVSLGCSTSLRNISQTIMHELGHNLGLRHGGDENCNYKPNYNSVMNYRYQFPGVDSNCTPPGDGVIDFSIGSRITLDENALDEDAGICGPGNPWDWNDDGLFEAALRFDVNSRDTACFGDITVLSDHDDWANLRFLGITDVDGASTTRSIEIATCQNVPPN